MLADRSIKNLIFDLGGVILDLSVDTTLSSFANLSGIEKSTVKRLFVSSPEFEFYEKGGISDEDFREFVKTLYRIDAPGRNPGCLLECHAPGISRKKLELLETLKAEV